MKSLIKLHRKYLFNKINVIITGSIILLAFFLSFIAIEPFLSYEEAWINRKSIASNYEQIYLMFVKIIMILLSSYMFTIHFNKKNEEYRYLLLVVVSKKKYYITKVLTLLQFIFIIGLILMINYISMGILLCNWFIINIEIVLNFVKIILLSYIYGIISLILTLFIKNIFSVLLSLGIYFLSEILLDINSNNGLIKTILTFFPTTDFVTNINNSYITIIYLTTLAITYYLISYFTYHNSE